MAIRRTKNATLSLAARLRIAPGDLTTARGEERLAVFYGARGTVMMAPFDDLPVVTVGTAPADDDSVRAAMPGSFLRQLDAAGIAARDALKAGVDAPRHVLGDGPRPRDEVGDDALAAVDYCVDALPAFELAGCTLMMLRPPAAVERCLER